MLESFLIPMSIPTANLSMHNVRLNKCSLLKVFCILEIIRSKRKGGRGQVRLRVVWKKSCL